MQQAVPGIVQRLLVALLVGLAAIVIETQSGGQSVVRTLELQTLDWRFRLRGPLPPGPETVLVMVDDATVAQLGAWPPPREVIGQAITWLAEARAKVIALNLLFTESRQPMSGSVERLLAAAAEVLPSEAEAIRQQIMTALAQSEPDLSLGVAIARAGRVVTPYGFVFDPAAANIAGEPPWIRATAYRVQTSDSDQEPALPTPRGLLVPAPNLASVGASTGHVTLQFEADGSLRAHLPALPYGNDLLPSLVVETVRLFAEVEHGQVSLDMARGIWIGEHHVATDPDLRQLVNYLGPTGTIPTYSLGDLLAARVEPALFRDRIVVLGASAAGAGERFLTPFSGGLPGAEFLATAIDNILHGRTLLRNETTRAVDLVGILALAILAAFAAGRRSPLVSLGAVLLLTAAWGGIVHLAFVQRFVWLAAFVPSVAAVTAGGIIEALRFAQETRHRRHLQRQRANLGRYFPPSVVEQLALTDAPRDLDRTQEAVVMFVDVVGFTRISERMSPAEAMALLRRFHTEVERAVFAHGGMVDKFMGDGALACFGVPEPLPMPVAATAALRAALDLLAGLQRAAGDTPDQPPLTIGIGLHGGPVLMGNVGGARQFQFTVIGDTVNVASRIEALTRREGTPLIASDAVIAAARTRLDPEIIARFTAMPEVQLIGRSQPVKLWRLKVPSYQKVGAA